MRRTIGPAYERAPAELVGRWLYENFLILASAVLVAILFCLLVNWIVDGLFNFLASRGIDDAPKQYSSNTQTVDMVKLFGSIVLIWLFCRNRT